MCRGAAQLQGGKSIAQKKPGPTFKYISSASQIINVPLDSLLGKVLISGSQLLFCASFAARGKRRRLGTLRGATLLKPFILTKMHQESNRLRRPLLRKCCRSKQVPAGRVAI